MQRESFLSYDKVIVNNDKTLNCLAKRTVLNFTSRVPLNKKKRNYYLFTLMKFMEKI